jgi:hypothetical protein
MDAKTRAIVLIKYKPMIQRFKDAIAEEYRAKEKGRRPTPTSSHSYSGAAPLLENFGLPAIKKCLAKLGGRGSPSIDLAGADQ